MDWEQLYKAYAADMLRTAYLFLKSKAWAEDVCHEVFLRCLVKMPKLDKEKERAYLIKCVVNLCKDELGKGFFKRRSHIDYASLDAILPSASTNHERDILNAVLTLPDELRNVFVLHDYQGFTIVETAKLLGIKQGTASGRIVRAREHLAQELKEEYL